MRVLAAGQSVLSATDDLLMASRLEKIPSGMTNSYKLYWLKAVIEEVLAGSAEVSFRRAAARMVASVWYPVNYFHLSLGAQDKLGEAVSVCVNHLGLGMDAKVEEVVSAVEGSNNEEVRSCIDALCRYVPFRLIRPFYDDRLNEIKAKEGSIRDSQVNYYVIQFNREDPEKCLYEINEKEDGLTVQPGWVRYLSENRPIVQGWLDMRITQYLQSRNPSVPAIPQKIYPPRQRDLTAASKYWKAVRERCGLSDIYAGVRFDAASEERLGPMSIDHFIPWSFVMHDMIWNLTPTFRNVNSSKSDRLPSIERHLDAFCSQQFDAMIAAREISSCRKALTDFLDIGIDYTAYDSSPGARMGFCSEIRKAIVPLHQIALNQGFAIWHG